MLATTVNHGEISNSHSAFGYSNIFFLNQISLAPSPKSSSTLVHMVSSLRNRPVTPMPNPIPRLRRGRRKATQSRIARTSVEPPATTSTTTADPLTTNEPPLHLLTRQSPVLSSSSSSAPFHSVTNQTPFQGPDTFRVQQQNTHGMDTQASSFINNLNLPNDFNAGGGSDTIVGFTRDLDTNGTRK
jgi:hypothetical protein